MEDIKLINSWDKVTLRTFKKLMVVVKEESPQSEEFTIKILSILNDKSEDYFLEMDLKHIPAAIKSLEFLSSEIPKQLIHKFNIDGVTYKLTLPKDMTWGQRLNYVEGLTRAGDDYASLLSIVLIPEGKKYAEGYDIIELKNKLEDTLMITEVLSITLFFSIFLRSITKTTLTSLSKKLKKEMKKEKNQEKRLGIEKAITAVKSFTGSI